MAAISTIIAGAGLALGAAGTAAQFVGQRKAQQGAEKAERLRRAQSELESQRERRSIVRQSLQARASALSAATAQGAESGSGLSGGYGQIQGQGGSALVASQQSRDLGAGMFAANRQISTGQTISSFGSGISSLGGALVQNSETIGRIGNYFTQNRAARA